MEKTPFSLPPSIQKMVATFGIVTVVSSATAQTIECSPVNASLYSCPDGSTLILNTDAGTAYINEHNNTVVAHTAVPSYLYPHRLQTDGQGNLSQWTPKSVFVTDMRAKSLPVGESTKSGAANLAATSQFFYPTK